MPKLIVAFVLLVIIPVIGYRVYCPYSRGLICEPGSPEIVGWTGIFRGTSSGMVRECYGIIIRRSWYERQEMPKQAWHFSSCGVCRDENGTWLNYDTMMSNTHFFKTKEDAMWFVEDGWRRSGAKDPLGRWLKQ